MDDEFGVMFLGVGNNFRLPALPVKGYFISPDRGDSPTRNNQHSN